MLIITQLPDKRLSIKTDYFYRKRIKAIPTAVFNFESKEWIIDSCMFNRLEHDFAGELVFKTPRWVILNQPMPDMSAMYKITDSSIKTPALKLNPYDYQDYGIRFMVDKIINKGFVLNSDDVGLGNI